MNENVRRPWLWTTVFTVIAIAYLFPIALVVVNSFKNKVFIAAEPFALPNAESFVGWDNYLRGIQLTDFIASAGWSFVITIGSAIPCRAGPDISRTRPVRRRAAGRQARRRSSPPAAGRPSAAPRNGL